MDERCICAHCDTSRTHQKLWMGEVTTDRARLCMGEMKETCEESGIQLNTSVRYSPESNGVAERTVGVLTSAVRANVALLWPSK